MTWPRAKRRDDGRQTVGRAVLADADKEGRGLGGRGAFGREPLLFLVSHRVDYLTVPVA